MLHRELLSVWLGRGKGGAWQNQAGAEWRRGLELGTLCFGPDVAGDLFACVLLTEHLDRIGFVTPALVMSLHGPFLGRSHGNILSSTEAGLVCNWELWRLCGGCQR